MGGCAHVHSSTWVIKTLRPTPAVPALAIGGFTPLTTIDFPGQLAAVVFCQGCPWRCRYCQNAHLIPRHAQVSIAWDELLTFLNHRRGLLDGVVFSGGEPTLQRGLGDGIRAVRALGFKTGLHTAGAYPQRLAAALASLDWVGMDIKAPAASYEALTRRRGSGDRAWESARLVLDSGVAYEFRTTVHPDLLDRQSLRALAYTLAEMGVEHYVLQECVTSRCLDKDLRPASVNGCLDESLATEIGRLFPNFAIRCSDADTPRP